MRAIAQVFTEPFIAHPELAQLSLEQRERRQHAALLRLIIICLLAVHLSIGIPAAAVNGSPSDVWTQVFLVGVGIVCLALNAAGWTTLAGALYIYIPMMSIVMTVLQDPGGLDAKALVFFSAFSVFILATGLLLPRPLLWLTLTLALGLMLWAVATLPLAPAFSRLASGEALRGLVGAALSVAYIMTAILAWVFARSGQASIETVGRALERERELTALKDQFIIDANHELRTPIMALYNNLELLNMLGEGGDADLRADLLRQALRSGDGLLRVLNSVLDAGALESQAPRVEPRTVPLAPLVRAVLETFDPREIGEPGAPTADFQKRPVTIHIPATLVVWADESRLRQILVNLFANALKYSPPGTPISIVAFAYADERRGSRSGMHHEDGASQAGVAEVSVRDQGLGIPPRDAPKLFNRFVRLPRDIAGPVRGTGVGLYLCRVLVEAMGGRIWVESTGVPGEGSAFHFTLPLASAEDEPQPAELPPTGAARLTR
jgi:signal transduction histidine kinase